MKTTKYLLLLITISLFFWGCKKYEDGPFFTLVSAQSRLVNHQWALDQYLRNNVDETSYIVINTITYLETYGKDGTYTVSYYDDSNKSINESGKWEFENKKDGLHLSGISSYSKFCSTYSYSLSSSHVTILKLTKDEYWYTFEDGGDTHELHLKAVN